MVNQSRPVFHSVLSKTQEARALQGNTAVKLILPASEQVAVAAGSIYNHRFQHWLQ